MSDDRTLPAPGLADVRVTASTPDVARQVAALLKRYFAGAEQRSYPAGPDGSGTLLLLTVDTRHTPEPAGGRGRKGVRLANPDRCTTAASR